MPSQNTIPPRFSPADSGERLPLWTESVSGFADGKPVHIGQSAVFHSSRRMVVIETWGPGSPSRREIPVPASVPPRRGELIRYLRSQGCHVPFTALSELERERETEERVEKVRSLADRDRAAGSLDSARDPAGPDASARILPGEEILVFHFSLTGLGGYRYYQGGSSIFELTQPVLPVSHIKAKGLGRRLESSFDPEETLWPNLTSRTVKDSVSGEPVAKLVLGSFARGCRWIVDDQVMEVSSENGEEVFSIRGRPVAAIRRIDHAPFRPFDPYMDLEPRFAICMAEELSPACRLAVLLHPSMRF